MSSNKTHQLLQKDPDEFAQYYHLYRKWSKKWKVLPWKFIAGWCQPNEIVADFGCGEAFVAQTLIDNEVHSFDHIALNEHVTECDISSVPLQDESIDVAIFSLSSQMGANCSEYIKESHRCLKNGGKLYLVELSSQTDDKRLKQGIIDLGFRVTYSRHRGEFLFIKAERL